MKNVHGVILRNESKEELLSDLAPDFPYMASYVEMGQYAGTFAPWHWHSAVEIFYIESGELEYHTPKEKHVFSAGSGGFVNTGVLHMTKCRNVANKTIQLLHIFDTVFLGGIKGSRIEQRYINPITAVSQINMIAFCSENPAHQELLKLLWESFQLSESDFAYEIKLRAVLSEIWCHMLTVSASLSAQKENYAKVNDQLKRMMTYIHEHYSEKITIAKLASTAFISERECFRTFRDYLHMTPADYIKDYRIQAACCMLINSTESITTICSACGLGSSSYFGKVFRESVGCTPMEYRRKWQDRNI